MTSPGTRYGWLDDSEWQPHTVAALAVLLGTCAASSRLPRQNLDSGGDEEFWAAIETYLAARSSG